VPIRTATENDLATINDVWLDADGVDDRRPGVLPLHAQSCAPERCSWPARW
jgi:hypothetical protein